MTEFSVWAPQHDRVRVLVDGTPHLMSPDAGGWWRASVEDAGPGTAYAFLLGDDETPLPDPRSRRQPTGVHGASQVYDDSAFFWTDQSWTGRQLPGNVLYELHIGTFTPDGTFDSADRAARPPRRPGRRPGRGAARQRRGRPAQLGLRRRRLVRRHRELRRPGRVQAVRRRLPRPRPRGGARRRPQPPGPLRRLPGPVRALLRRQQHLGPLAEPRRGALGARAPVRDRQRPDVAARLPRRRAAARRRPRAARLPRHAPAGSRCPSRSSPCRRTWAGRSR